jgi:hypothetical protein
MGETAWRISDNVDQRLESAQNKIIAKVHTRTWKSAKKNIRIFTERSQNSFHREGGLEKCVMLTLKASKLSNERRLNGRARRWWRRAMLMLQTGNCESVVSGKAAAAP